MRYNCFRCSRKIQADIVAMILPAYFERKTGPCHMRYVEDIKNIGRIAMMKKMKERKRERGRR